MRHTIHLLIADEHLLFGDCLASALSIQDGLRIGGVAAGFDDAVAKVRANLPDILLIGTGLPRHNVLALIKHISRDSPRTKVIILGSRETESDTSDYIELGVSGYLMNDASLDDLTSAIRSVYNGEQYRGTQIAQSSLSPIARRIEKPSKGESVDLASLSLREVEILRLMADGLSNKQISSQLYISLHTTKNHVHSILQKLNARRRSEAVSFALNDGLLRMADLRRVGSR